MNKIPLSQGKIALIDDEDFEKVNKFKWHYGSGGYANRHPQMIKGVRHGKIMMHNFILKPQKGFLVDHINRNKLDNRKKNLRYVTTIQNSWNSKFLGITYHKRDKRWQARVQNNGKRMQLGYFSSRDEALKAREKFLFTTRGEYAYTG